MEIIESPFVAIIADLAKNNKNLTPELQNAIARYLDLQTYPKISMDASLLKADFEDFENVNHKYL